MCWGLGESYRTTGAKDCGREPEVMARKRALEARESSAWHSPRLQRSSRAMGNSIGIAVLEGLQTQSWAVGVVVVVAGIGGRCK